MSGHVKVGGVWKTANSVRVKVGGAWKTATSAYIRVGGAWKVWFVSLITDTFNRTDSSSLGTTSSGATWTNIRGTSNWGIVSNKASNSSAGSSYAIAAVDTGTNDITVSATVTNGTGVAFWVSDANNWWASHGHSTTGTGSSCGGGATAWSTTNPGSCTCGSVESQVGAYCDGPATGNIYTTQPDCNGCGTATSALGNYCYGGYTAGTCAGAGGTWNSSTSQCCFDEYRYGCSATFTTQNEYRCSDSLYTYTTYQHYLRIIKSVGGTVSTVGSDVALSSAATAVKVVTLNDSITARAYSDAAMTNLLGTNSNTPSSPTKAGKHGIIKAPSAYNQGSTVDDFSAGA